VDSCAFGLVRGHHWQHFGVVHIQTGVPVPFVQTFQSAGNVPICRLSIRWEGGMARRESSVCTDYLRLLPAFLRSMTSFLLRVGACYSGQVLGHGHWLAFASPVHMSFER